jgi:hypothetical protein
MNEQSARRRGRHLHTTQQTQEMNIHVLSGIRTRDSSNQAVSELRLRLHGHISVCFERFIAKKVCTAQSAAQKTALPLQVNGKKLFPGM